MKTPTHLQHKPIIGVDDYDQIDGKYANDTDAMSLSIGLAQWENNDDDISAKVFRRNNEKWLRQGEELPPHRVLDLSILFIASIMKNSNDNKSLTYLNEKVMNVEDLNKLQVYYQKNQKKLCKRINELQRVINIYFNE